MTRRRTLAGNRSDALVASLRAGCGAPSMVDQVACCETIEGLDAFRKGIVARLGSLTPELLRAFFNRRSEIERGLI